MSSKFKSQMQIKNNLLLRLSDLLVVSGKVMTVFSLIVIPILVILSHYYIYEQARSVGHFELDPKQKKSHSNIRLTLQVSLTL